jgi:hypothetical protein
VGYAADRHERRRSQVDCARLVLERSATLLLTSSKCFLCHPNLPSARENRDTVFCQMRRALDLIHYIIKEGVVECGGRYGIESVIGGISTGDPSGNVGESGGNSATSVDSTVMKALKYFVDSVVIMHMSPVSDCYNEQVTTCLDSIVESTQDFTDSAYTSHDRRQNILHHCERSKAELAHLLNCMDNGVGGSAAGGMLDIAPTPMHAVDQAMRNLLKTTTVLRIELQQTALEHSYSLIRNCRIGSNILMELREAALTRDAERQQFQSQRFLEHVDYIEDVSKLVRHVTSSESAQIRAKHAQINLRIYGPQVCVAAKTLLCGGQSDNHSKVARSNLETFCNMWQSIMEDVVMIAKQIQQNAAVAAGAMSGFPLPPLPPSSIMLDPLPPPGVVNTTVNLNPPPPPMIMKQPPTPNQTSPCYPMMPGPPPGSQHRLLAPPLMGGGPQDQSMGGGKFNKSVPNLSSSAYPNDHLMPPHLIGRPGGGGGGGGPAGPGMGGGGGGNFLDPNLIMHNGAIEPRRHSTSGVPGQYSQQQMQMRHTMQQQPQPSHMAPPHFPPMYNHPAHQQQLQQQQQQQQHQLQYPYYQQSPPHSLHSSRCSPEEMLNSYKDVENNAIVQRAKKMVGQANDMYDFIRGYNAKVKNTQDLFTLAEYLSEESNELYKLIRVFSYDVPTGEDKRSLMAIADHVPKHCTQLQMLIQSTTVGKAATFTKVDSVIRETRAIIELVVRVVEVCFANAQKYNLDFSNVVAPDTRADPSDTVDPS